MSELTVPEACEQAIRFHKAGQTELAESMYRQIKSLQIDRPDDLQLLAMLAFQLGHCPDAEELIRRAIVLNPASAQCRANLGMILATGGQPDEAIVAFREALALAPNSAEAHNNLGNALRAKGKLDEAVSAYRQAAVIRPDYAEAYSNLAKVLQSQCLWDQAIEAYVAASRLRPDTTEIHNNLGIIFRELGRLDEAIENFKTALRISSRPDILSNLLYTRMFHFGYDAAALLLEHRVWDERFARPLWSEIRPHANRPDPERRLRLGYVSPDFRTHSQSQFTVPLLSHHDQAAFKVFCYSDVARPDALTYRLKRCADTWQSIVGISHQDVAEMVRRDRIDILVDLTLHMSNNRLLVFARKPAPVQVTWLGYPGTTGLNAIDYRLSDPYLDPLSSTGAAADDEGIYSEKTFRLPASFWCYDPLAEGPPVNQPPVLTNGHVTFGCLNSFAKVNDDVLDLWSKVLATVAESRMLILAPPGSARQRVLSCLSAHGVGAERVEFVDLQPRPHYLQTYHRIDLCLDTFPANGHTTSMDSLWMGVPVVTLVGRTAIARGGLSILSNLQLADLAAHSAEEFVRIASALAGNLSRLSEFRSTLRQRMQSSPLMDAPRFARDIESAFRSMWKTWCESQGRLPTV